MATKKTPYTTKRGYKYSPKKYEELKRNIYNYNRRVKRATEKVPEEYRYLMPKTLSIKDIRDRVASTKDVNETVKRLNIYRKEGFEFTENPYGIGYTTKAQVEVVEREARQENARRRQIKYLAGDFEETGRLPSDDDGRLAKVSPDRFMTGDPLANDLYGRTINEKTVQWQLSYLRQLDDVKENILNGKLFYGYSQQDKANLVNMINEINYYLLTMTPEQYYAAMLRFPQINIQSLYPEKIEEAIYEIYDKFTEFANIVGLPKYDDQT